MSDRVVRQGRRATSALMTVGTNLGVDVFRRHAEHVIATHADAVNDGPGIRLGFRGTFQMRVGAVLGFGAHGPILTQPVMGGVEPSCELDGPSEE